MRDLMVELKQLRLHGMALASRSWCVLRGRFRDFGLRDAFPSHLRILRRPGVANKLGLGPKPNHLHNRMTTIMQSGGIQ